MLKEIVIILAAIGCIFLIIPLALLAPFNVPTFLGMPITLLFIVLSYAGYDAKKLRDKREYDLLHSFVLILIGALVLSTIMLFLIYPLFAPKFYL